MNIKKISIYFSLILFLITLPVFSYSAGIGVLPFKVSSYSTVHKHFSDDIAELMSTRLAFTSRERVISYSMMKVAVRNLRLTQAEFDINAVKRLMGYLRADYLITGEIVVNYEGLILRSKLLKVKNNAVVIVSKTFLRGTNHSKFELVNLTEKAIKELSQGVFRNEFAFGRKFISSADYDIMLVLDSTSKMDTELKFIARKITKIFARIQYINPAAKIRIGVVDFKDKEDAYRAKIFNFSTDIKLIRKHLYSLRAYGGHHVEGVDTAYGLYYALVKGNWKSSNRIIYLVTSSKPAEVPQNYRFSEIIRKAKKMGVTVNILGASELPFGQRGYYKAMAEYTGGHYHDILYNLSFYLEQKGKSNFIYKHHYLFMMNVPVHSRKWMYQYYFNERNAQDITLGRIIQSIVQVKEFLIKEGFKISSQSDETTLNIDTDIDYIIENSMKPKMEKQFTRLPRVQFASAGRSFYVYVGNDRALAYMRRNLRTGMTILVGAAIKPSLSPSGFDMDPLSVIFTTRRDGIARILVETPGEISRLAYYFKESGLFDEKLWFILGRIVSIRY